jgi:general secretion pathway protein A
MYLDFFNLRQKPFELVPNPDFLYMSRTHSRALQYLEYGLREKAGFILLTGDIGCGKTTLIRDFIKRLDGSVTVSKVMNTKVDSEQLISMINDDFGLESKGKDKIALLKELCDFLISEYTRGSHSVLIIDEAQNLTPDLLEEVRLLSNLETDNAKLLQIILIGQPELRRTLSLPDLKQLRQRISINCHIYPLTKVETEEYILYRLEKAGNREAVCFTEEAFDIIYNYSKGIPRLVNIICDFLLLSAFVEETRELDAEIAQDIVGDLAFENLYWGTDGAQETTGAQSDDNASQFARNYGDGEIRSLLKHLILRVDALEKNASHGCIDNASHEGIDDVTKRLDVLEKKFSVYREKLDNSLLEITNIPKVNKEPQVHELRNSGDLKMNRQSLFKRILGI